MRTFSRTGQLKKDVKRADKRGKNLAKLKTVLDQLIEGEPLPAQYRDHPLCAANLQEAAIVISNRIGF